MLITCPECDGQVSSIASCCPHCGFPISKPAKRTNRSKRMRLPNGFGRIVELKGKNLRKPFRVMVTVGKDENGRPIGKILKPEGYFSTYNDAYKALMEYHATPYDFDNTVTLEEIYAKWYEGYSKKVSASRKRHVDSAWTYMAIFHSTKIKEIRQKMVKTIILESYKLGKNGEKIYPPDTAKTVIKTILVEVMDYAVANEIIERNYAKDVRIDIDGSVKNPHESLSKEEISVIENLSKENIIAQMIKFQCYTGLRPNELCCIEVSKVNTSEWYFIAGSKTEAGKNRIIPVHKNIRDLFLTKYNEAITHGYSFLFGSENGCMNYSYYYDHFKNIIPEHRPHDCRKHFITMAKKSGVDEYAIKRIVGHAITDITEAIYTDRDVEWLHDEISKIRRI